MAEVWINGNSAVREGADATSFRFLTHAEAWALLRDGARRLAEAARNGSNAEDHRNPSRGRDGRHGPRQRAPDPHSRTARPMSCLCQETTQNPNDGTWSVTLPGDRRMELTN